MRAHWCVLVAAVVASPGGLALAGTRGSTGTGLWSLTADFTDVGVQTSTSPLNGLPGIIPQLDKGSLVSQGAVSSDPPNQSVVQAVGAFSHWTQSSPFDPSNSNHFGVFTVAPSGAFTDNGDLAAGDGVIEYRFDFNLDFFVDGTGIPAVPLSLTLGLNGFAPEGYRINYEFSATWTDTTTGAPGAAAVTLSDTETFDAFNVAGGLNASTVLNDNGVFGPIVMPAFDDRFSVDGFFRVTVDKKAGAMLPGPPPNVFRVVVIPDVGGFIQLIPEPGSATLLLLFATPSLALRRRR
ncbi:hypothetical protein Pla123a_03230 [Posidoniimonas polymericola]|uniref:PEP-CTERM protein-sorting domain-containing protein n=1 Tax=Posidoniimonas polymericola TaxID=2528002 RepID=A0A5C5ZED1_9BACT|nr:hypothetical protein [Posidoniimonas polymericola]TWT85516.1 hypothetical protein Pla123a_03230 [Posidoniimonas polymericola]